MKQVVESTKRERESGRGRGWTMGWMPAALGVAAAFGMAATILLALGGPSAEAAAPASVELAPLTPLPERILTPGPDVTVIYLGSTSNYGVSGGVRGYSVGTTSCNVGDKPIWWCNDAGDPFCEVTQHPVIAQNMYRLKNGRFEQIGMGWLKHGFLSTNSFDSACGSCVIPPHGGDQLGVGCTDTYGSSLNGSRPLGMRSEVNPASGKFPYPYTQVGTSTVTDQRIKVLESELNPALNAGARYWVEGHYIAEDDAAASNAFNNASYREVTVNAGTFNLSFSGGTVRELPAIAVWPTIDATVELVPVDVAAPDGLERFHVARKVTQTGPTWHYEYAIHNMNSKRAARSFTVQFPGGATLTNAGFRDVDHHSGEPYATTDWTVAIDGGAGSITWSTDTFAANANANALRWGTMFSFWFDSSVGPEQAAHTLGLFETGTPQQVSFHLGTAFFGDGFEAGNTSGWTSEVTEPDVLVRAQP